MQGRELRRLVEAMVWAMDQESAKLRRALERVEAVATAQANLAPAARSEVVETTRAVATEALGEAELRARRVLLYAEYVVARVGRALLE